MQSLSIPDIAKTVEGIPHFTKEFESINVSNIITDSRTFFAGKNTAFLAITGKVNDGHDYIPSLKKKGVKVFIVSSPEVVDNEAVFILVNDTTKALHKLAAFNRKAISFPVIGITGSNGKTIVKEWLYHILSASYNIVRSPKSYNSQIGVPLSVLLIDDSFNLGIFEAGISKPNEMNKLADILTPGIGILTNIGDAHQENFNSLEEKLREKLVLFRNSKKLIYRADDSGLKKEIQQFCKKNNIEPISWTTNNNTTTIRYKVEKFESQTSIEACVKKEVYNFVIPFVDDSAIENACHCFATFVALETNIESYAHRFKDLQQVAMRLEIKQGINNCLLINDYYNSDLNSLSIALSVLGQQTKRKHQLKQIILSDIQQTGIPLKDLYKKVNKLLLDWGIHKITGIGKEIFFHQNEFTLEKEFFSSPSEFEAEFSRRKYKDSAILIKGAREFRFERISSLLQEKAHQTVLEINLNALVNNLNTFRNLLQPSTKIMVMVKAFSYGSGDVEIARLLQYHKVDYLAVAVADEGVQLRNAGITIPIVVMNPEQDSFQNIIDNQLEPNIYSSTLLDNFIKQVSLSGRKEYPIHLKIDSGMNRLGFKDASEISKALELLRNNSTVKIKSAFSHLSASDDPIFDEFTQAQFSVFNKLFSFIANHFDYSIEKHILNSAGIERFPGHQYDMVRLGIGLYGISQTGLPLEAIGTLKSTISQIKEVNTNETIGYSRNGKVFRSSKIAIVPLGYADGLDRKLGNGNGNAFVNNRRVPIIGNICMDMLMLDITETNAKPGDRVEFFGENISITELAEQVGTIPYEILTGISQRVKRVYLQE